MRGLLVADALSLYFQQERAWTRVAVAAEASLRFLGVGVQAPMANWGSMRREAATSMRLRALPVVVPRVVIAATVVAFALIGDGFGDAPGTGRENR